MRRRDEMFGMVGSRELDGRGQQEARERAATPRFLASSCGARALSLWLQIGVGGRPRGRQHVARESAGGGCWRWVGCGKGLSDTSWGLAPSPTVCQQCVGPVASGSGVETHRRRMCLALYVFAAPRVRRTVHHTPSGDSSSSRELLSLGTGFRFRSVAVHGRPPGGSPATGRLPERHSVAAAGRSQWAQLARVQKDTRALGLEWPTDAQRPPDRGFPPITISARRLAGITSSASPLICKRARSKHSLAPPVAAGA